MVTNKDLYGDYIKTGNISGTGIAVGPNAKVEMVSYIERRRPPAPREAPPLPPYYLERDDLTKQLTERLTNQAQMVIAVSGPAGIGKTTVASATTMEASANFHGGVLLWQFTGQPDELRDMVGSFLVSLDVETPQLLPSKIDSKRSAPLYTIDGCCSY